MKKFIFGLAFLLAAPTAFAHKFTDVNSFTTFQDGVAFLEQRGIVNGYDDGTFRPNISLNRAEMLKIVAEGTAVYAGENNSIFDSFLGQNCFEDVPKDEWYTKYVCYAKENGWVEGYEGGKLFRPEQKVSFVEGLKMTLEGFAIEYPETEVWYKGLVDTASSGLYIPNTLKTFDQNLKRQEMAELITRIIKEKEGTGANHLANYGYSYVSYNSLEAKKDVSWSAYASDDDPVLGDADAPVTVVEFSDYQCPFCSMFHTNTFGDIKEKYIDTGLVKFVYRDFPLSFHNQAENAAIAAECVDELLGDEAYYQMHDTIFENQAELSEQFLLDTALDLGADETEYEDCIVSEAVLAEIEFDIAEGKRMGVTGTPNFFINGKPLGGAQPFSAFDEMLTEAVAASM